MTTKEETIANLVSSGYLKSKRVIEAMRTIPREEFLPEGIREQAWADFPLPIGFSQTISAPHMYAIMLEAAKISRGCNVLEIGAGSGYGAALLSFLAGKKGRVTSIELVPQLASFARANLLRAGASVEIIKGDGHNGCKKHSPYDRILVTAACKHVPPPLLCQLAPGGRMVVPVGEYIQELLLIENSRFGMKTTPLLQVRFVPLLRKEES